jgi:hypothetical protein
MIYRVDRIPYVQREATRPYQDRLEQLEALPASVQTLPP